MLTTDSGRKDSADERLDQVVAEYVRGIEEGNEPDRDELLARHPDLADDLREFFNHRDSLKDLFDPLRSAVARVLNVRCPHCHHAIELLDEAQISDISCPTCGSSFSLVSGGSTRQFPSGLKRIGQFQLIERVGVGQFGSVWKARDLTLERTVAVKIPRATHLSKEEAELFIRDARLGAKLTHPNIVPVHEVGKHEGVIYIVSDFIRGATLKEWMKVKRVSETEAAQLCLTICQALHHAHEAGVIHRDLKPGNVILDVKGEPHLVDFGLAKRDTDEITMTLDGQVLGTPAYMSPEQARGEGHHVDCRADVYSMGVLLFELLTGELPFRGDRQMLIVQILSDDPPSLRRLDNSVPRDLETICLKCLRKEPEKRYASAAALADDLQRWLDNRPIQARPVSRFERAWLCCRRRPAISTLVALLVVVVIAAVLLSHEVRQQERADGLVNRLFQSDVVEAPAIISQLVPLRKRVRSRLRHESDHAAPNGDPDRRLIATLATFRLYGDEEDVQWLYEQMLTARPADVPVLHQTLAIRKHEIVEPLWELAASRDADMNRRIRACCALAAYDPSADKWPGVAPFVADKLSSVSLTELSVWRDQLETVCLHLIGPLQRILQDDAEWLPKRNFAAACLAHYLADDPEALFDLLMDFGEQQFLEFFPPLAEHRIALIELLEAELAKAPPDSTDPEQVQSFRRRRAMAAIAAWRAGCPSIARAVLKHHPDPGSRTRFVHWAAPFGVDPQTILAELHRETDGSVRQALVLSLAEFNSTQLLPTRREQLIPKLLALYRDAPDASLHGGVEWLLREWGYDAELEAVAKEIQKSRGHQGGWEKQWLINSQGHTMVVVQAGDFLMGAPFDVISTANSPRQQPARIGRTFAIASTVTTRAQFDVFRRQTAREFKRFQPNEYSSASEHPQNHVSWYDAVAYCNWLSEQEGINEDQWCYLPNIHGQYAKGMTVAPDFLSRRGYRLPTEAEWEYACRGGTTTLRPFGDSTTFMRQYAWFARRKMQAVGMLKPNYFGLFDMLGNASEWYQEPGSYPARKKQPLYIDEHLGNVLQNRRAHGARGGSFNGDASRLDSADRSLHYRPTHAHHSVSFRIARTVIPAAHDEWIKAHLLGKRGQWSEAAELMLQVVPLMDDDTSVRKYADLHITLLLLDDRDRIIAVSDEMLHRFGNTTHPRVAHLVAQCLLAVPDLEITAQLEHLAELSVSVRNWTHYRDMGMLRYRQNQLQQAEDWLNQAARSNFLRGKPKTLYFLAMTRHARGDEDGARQAFQHAEEIRERIRAGFTDDDYGEKWPDWILIECIRREAGAVLGRSASAGLSSRTDAP